MYPERAVFLSSGIDHLTLILSELTELRVKLSTKFICFSFVFSVRTTLLAMEAGPFPTAFTAITLKLKLILPVYCYNFETEIDIASSLLKFTAITLKLKLILQIYCYNFETEIDIANLLL